MNAFHSISSWWKRFSRKRRLSMLNATDNVEEWYTHISPAGLLAAFLAFALLLFILILSIVAYTPVLELLPGYRVEAARSRENLMQSVIRLDSMERMMNDMITYNNNIALIMEGKTPVVRTVGKEDSIRTNKTLVVPSREDSLLRAELEEKVLTASGRAQAAVPHASPSKWSPRSKASSSSGSTSNARISASASPHRPTPRSSRRMTAWW